MGSDCVCPWGGSLGASTCNHAPPRRTLTPTRALMVRLQVRLLRVWTKGKDAAERRRLLQFVLMPPTGQGIGTEGVAQAGAYDPRAGSAPLGPGQGAEAMPPRLEDPSGGPPPVPALLDESLVVMCEGAPGQGARIGGLAGGQGGTAQRYTEAYIALTEDFHHPDHVRKWRGG
jgi:hypothetical protein